ncbi:hypothetical protein GCM10023231_33640 [Olivibacter ginsenosidimutans]|uniref:Antitoxin Xre/MbcA/ParS-like toxin-binding domain-containing protein n=1 Tax=Olivibacter ginsenosidimutans TaxID=1176537 RepID=A0ABP9BXP3_9SPHI
MSQKKVKTAWNVTSLLGGQEVLSTSIKTEFDLIALGNQGLTKASLDALVTFLGIPKKAFVEGMLDMSVKTIERKKEGDLLDRHTSSHLIEIAKVVAHAVEVFEDEDKVRDWLAKTNRSLNGMRPLELFAMPTGLALVNTVLGRIEEGVYS